MPIKKITIKDFTDDQIEAEFLARYRKDIYDDTTAPEVLEVIFKDLGSVENIDILFKHLVAKDMYRFFNTPVEGQAVVRGAVLRTQYLLQEARKATGRGKKKRT